MSSTTVALKSGYPIWPKDPGPYGRLVTLIQRWSVCTSDPGHGINSADVEYRRVEKDEVAILLAIGTGDYCLFLTSTGLGWINASAITSESLRGT